MVKINGNEIRKGNVIEHKNGLWIAVKTSHVKPGKGGAFAQVELKNIRTHSKLNERFRSADKIERVRLEQKDYQFLYKSDVDFIFMDNETFEQITIKEDALNVITNFLTEGLVVQIEFFENSVDGKIFRICLRCLMVQSLVTSGQWSRVEQSGAL